MVGLMVPVGPKARRMGRTCMNIDTMRWIDRNVGVVACAIATPLVRLWHWVADKPPAKPARMLFIELSEMGSTFLADPALRKAREQIGAELFFVIFKRNMASVELIGTVPSGNIFTIRDTSLFHLVYDAFAFMLWTRRKRIDCVVDLELFSRFTALLASFSGATRRVGFYRFHGEGLYRGEMLTHRVAYNPHIHIAKNFIALVDALLAEAPTVPYSKTLIDDEQITPPVIHVSDEARAGMLVRLRECAGFDPAIQRLVLINPNASGLLPHRRWMPDRYAELVGLLLDRQRDVIVVITGAPDEREEAEALAEACGPRCVSFAGLTSLAELPALYSHASAIVTNDSGPAHFAAATLLPTIVLFGPETPKLYQPLGSSQAIYAGLACSPCVGAHNHRKTACTDNVCMRAISVEQVYRTLESTLAQRAGNPALVS
jgi:ADP-heptose:LPS heptosyltransferase